jgi:flagellar assembly protein FliH
MSDQTPRKFIFETVFAADGEATAQPRPQRLFTRQEVELIRTECFEKGQYTALVRAQEQIVQAQEALIFAEEARVEQEQERVAAEQARVVAEQHTLVAVEALIQDTQAAFSTMSQVTHEHWKSAAELAMVCARRIAGEALDHFPAGAVVAAMEALATEIKAEPRVTVRAGPAWAQGFQTALDQKARALGLGCQVLVTTDPALPIAAFDFNWGDGRASFDPETAAQKISAALTLALSSAAAPLAPTASPSPHRET